MKLHIGTDPKGRVHRVTATHAGAHDGTQLRALLHGEERAIYEAYWKEVSFGYDAMRSAASRRRRRGCGTATVYCYGYDTAGRLETVRRNGVIVGFKRCSGCGTIDLLAQPPRAARRRSESR